MLNFYHETYLAGDCCWSEEGRIKKIAAQTKKALNYAADLDNYEDMDTDELLALVEKEPGFQKYVEKWEKKTDTKVENKMLLSGIAWDYLEKKIH